MASLEFSDDGEGFGSDQARDPRTEENKSGDDDDDEAEAEAETRRRRIDPSSSKKRVVRNPLPKLNAQRIQGPKGIRSIEEYFETFQFRGKGHEKSDLDKVMKRLEHWAHRLFPKYRFDDFLDRTEALGAKKNVQVYLKKYRLGTDTPVVDIPDEPEEPTRVDRPESSSAPVDRFDRLVAEQIEKQRRRADDDPVGASRDTSDEIKERIEANRKLAIERKNAREKRIREENERIREENERRRPEESRDALANSPAVESKRDDESPERSEPGPPVDSPALVVERERRPAEEAPVDESCATRDSDRPLSKDEMQMEIDNAIEEIIGRNARRLE